MSDKQTPEPSDVAYHQFNAAFDRMPTDLLCEREVEISIVEDRCIYINDYRVQGGKPYFSENLPTKNKKAKLRSILEAFSDGEIEAYLREKQQRKAYMDGVRALRDVINDCVVAQIETSQ